jgi:septum formation protein
MKKIILASRSADRNELFKHIKIPFDVMFSDIDEEYYKENFLDPYELVQKLAKAKALNIKNKLSHTNLEALIIAADTVVEIKGTIIGKAVDKDHAFRILKKLSGQSHNLITGIAITEVSHPKLICDYDKTIVHFSNISENEIKAYLETDEWIGRAGAYSIRERAALFIDSIEGSFSNVVGLPLNKIFRIIKDEFRLNLLELYNH